MIYVMGTKSEDRIKTKVDSLHDMKQLLQSQGIDWYDCSECQRNKLFSCQNVAVAVGEEGANKLMRGLVQLLS